MLSILNIRQQSKSKKYSIIVRGRNERISSSTIILKWKLWKNIQGNIFERKRHRFGQNKEPRHNRSSESCVKEAGRACKVALISPKFHQITLIYFLYWLEFSVLVIVRLYKAFIISRPFEPLRYEKHYGWPKTRVFTSPITQKSNKLIKDEHPRLIWKKKGIFWQHKIAHVEKESSNNIRTRKIKFCL